MGTGHGPKMAQHCPQHGAKTDRRGKLLDGPSRNPKMNPLPPLSRLSFPFTARGAGTKIVLKFYNNAIIPHSVWTGFETGVEVRRLKVL